MARRIVITSGKGGVGKTTTAYLLGYNLAKMGSKVVILDLDIGLNNLDLVAGVDAKVNYDLCDILGQKCRVRQALVRCENNPRLYFLPCVNIADATRVTTSAIQEVINELNVTFDYLLIDCPAGIGFEFRRAIFYANEAIVVTTPHLIAIRDAGRVCNLLCGCIDNISLVVNRVKNDFVTKNIMYSPHEIATSLRIPLIGAIRENLNLSMLSTTTGSCSGLRESEMCDWAELAHNVALNRAVEQSKKVGFGKNF